MVDYYYRPQPAIDREGERIINEGTGSVYAINDDLFATPLTVRLGTQDGPTSTTIRVSAIGQTESYWLADHPEVNFKSGDLISPLVAWSSIVEDNRLMREQVEALVEQIDSGAIGGGSGVDDAGMASLVTDLDSSTGEALTDRFGIGFIVLDLDDDVPSGTPAGTVIIRTGAGGGGTGPAPTVYVSDLFERTLTEGWGSADIGGAWVIGAPTRLSVSGGAGRVQTNASEAQGPIIQGFSAADTETHAITSLAATAGARLLRIQSRRQSSSVYQQASIRQYGSAHPTSPGRVDVTFDESNYTTGVLTGVAADAKIHFKSRVTGSGPTLRQVKVWLDGNPEPAAWTATTNTATGPQDAGYSGIIFYSTGSEPGTAVHALHEFSVTGV